MGGWSKVSEAARLLTSSPLIERVFSLAVGIWRRVALNGPHISPEAASTREMTDVAVSPLGEHSAALAADGGMAFEVLAQAGSGPELFDLDLFGDGVAPVRHGGKPRHSPTDASRGRARELRAGGCTQEAIAAELRIGVSTFLRHYAAEAGARPPGTARGRMQHAPTPSTRDLVRQMRAAGSIQPEIAHALGISVPTLARHYRADLDATTPDERK